MAIYTIKEVSDLTGIKPKNIHTYASRGKLVKNSNGNIDTNELVNKVFLEKNSKVTAAVVEKETKPVTDKLPEKKSNRLTKAEKEKAALLNRATEIDIEKKEVELERKKIDLENEILKKQRLSGNACPKDQVELLFSSTIRNLSNTGYTAIKNVIKVAMSRNMIPREEAIDLEKHIIQEWNSQTAAANEKTQKEIKDIANDYKLKARG